MLGGVQAQPLLLFCYTQPHHSVKQEEDGGGEHEGVDPDGADAGELAGQLSGVVVNEAGSTPYGGDGEDTGGECAPGAADAVDAPDVQGVV